MLRRHALPLLLIASALPLAACSKSEPANTAGIDNGGVVNDEGAVDANATFGNDALLDNEVAPGGANAS